MSRCLPLNFACILGLVALSTAPAQAQWIWSNVEGQPGGWIQGASGTYVEGWGIVDVSAHMYIYANTYQQLSAYSSGMSEAVASMSRYVPYASQMSASITGLHGVDDAEFGWLPIGYSDDDWYFQEQGGSGGCDVPEITGISPNPGPGGDGYLEVYGYNLHNVDSAYLANSWGTSVIPVNENQVNVQSGAFITGSGTSR